jgi:hypothetical protein
MRTLAFIAFFALQLSVFTCGFDIHVHAMDSDMGHVAEHLHDEDSNHEQDSEDHGCHVHASHTFTALDAEYVENVPVLSTGQYHVLSGPILKNLSFLIEHPPKLFRS